jgi:hypothetical protein
VTALADAGVFDALSSAAVLELPERCTWMHQPHSRYLFLRPDSVQMLREVLRLYEAKKLGVVVTCAAPLLFGRLLIR